MSNDLYERYEHITRTLAITPEIEVELKKLALEGWEVVPGSMPVAVYHLRRLPPSAHAFGAFGGVTVDESKIQIIRADGRIE